MYLNSEETGALNEFENFIFNQNTERTYRHNVCHISLNHLLCTSRSHGEILYLWNNVAFSSVSQLNTNQ